jgi:hypothetical protein
LAIEDGICQKTLRDLDIDFVIALPRGAGTAQSRPIAFVE